MNEKREGLNRGHNDTLQNSCNGEINFGLGSIEGAILMETFELTQQIQFLSQICFRRVLFFHLKHETII